MSMRRVFVCSPLRAPSIEGFHQNRRLAKELTLAVLRAGHAPYTPHLWYSDLLDDAKPAEREKGMKAGAAWLRVADEIWVYAVGLEECSAGMKSEVQLAERLALPIRVVWMPEPFAEVRARWLAVDPPSSAPRMPAASPLVEEIKKSIEEIPLSARSVQLLEAGLADVRAGRTKMVPCGCDANGPSIACSAEGQWHFTAATGIFKEEG